MNKQKKKPEKSNWFESAIGNPSNHKKIIVAACVIVYAQILSFGLVHFDDYGFVLKGSSLLKLSNTLLFFKHTVFWVLGDSYKYGDTFYRPLQNVVYSICNTLSPKHAWGYHLVGLLLHIAASLALFNFLKELKYKTQVSLIFTLIYCVHPALVEAVAWIGGIGDQLATIFSLLSVTYFIKIVKAPDIIHRKCILIHFLAFAGALFSKEISVGLIPVYLCCLFIFKKDRWPRPVILIISIGWILILATYLILRHNAVPPDGSIMRSAMESFRTNGLLIFEYVEKIFLPFRLSPMVTRGDAHFIMGAIMSILILVLIVLVKKSSKLLLLGIVWFVVFLIPAFIQLNPQVPFYTFEHRLYLPIIGMLIVIMEL